MRKPRARLLLHATLLVALCLLVYSNSFDHAYNLDSHAGLVNNPYVRSLAHIPAYFADPLTLTSLRTNGDYRPVLQISYALNYQISGYNISSWHLVQVLLHAVCVLGLYGLCRRLTGLATSASDNGGADLLALAAAAIFAVHPTGSGVVNYLWARSSLLVAALLLPSMLLYFDDRRGAALKRGLACALYTLALFTKVEAVAALAVYFFYDALLRPRLQTGHRMDRSSLIRDILDGLNRQTLQRLAPFLGVTLIYSVVRIAVMPGYLAESRHAAGMTAWPYLVTQTTAWWHYVARWLAPVELVADHLAYPVSQSVLEPRVLLALAGWLGVALLLRWLYPVHPESMFLALSALALISPTSSVFPLAEMVNEHRPYLPLALLSLAVWIPSYRIGRKWVASLPLRRWVGYGVVVLLVGGLAFQTYQRNRVFLTEEQYWRDVETKAPSPRSATNYGSLLLADSATEQALIYFQRALALAPRWHVVHSNLGLTHEILGNHDLARQHHDLAVKYDSYSGTGLLHRGQFHVRLEQYELALSDFESSRSRDRFAIHKGLTSALAGLGRWQDALQHTRECLRLDAEATEASLTEMARPFWDSPQLYRGSLQYHQAVAQLLPHRPWLHQKTGQLALMLGEHELAEHHFALAQQLGKP